MINEQDVWTNSLNSLTSKIAESLVQKRLSNGVHANSNYCSLKPTSKHSWLQENQDSELFLEIFAKTEGCYPLLVERWVISYSQTFVVFGQADSQENVFLSSLMELATNLPNLSKYSLEYSFSSMITMP